MASRYSSISARAVSFLRHTSSKSTRPLLSPASLPRPPPPFPRISRELGALQSLMPFHSAVSSARLTSRLGIDSAGGSRSLSQETGLSVPR